MAAASRQRLDKAVTLLLEVLQPSNTRLHAVDIAPGASVHLHPIIPRCVWVGGGACCQGRPGAAAPVASAAGSLQQRRCTPCLMGPQRKSCPPSRPLPISHPTAIGPRRQRRRLRQSRRPRRTRRRWRWRSPAPLPRQRRPPFGPAPAVWAAASSCRPWAPPLAWTPAPSSAAAAAAPAAGAPQEGGEAAALASLCCLPGAA